MKVGASPGSGWAIAARFTLPYPAAQDHQRTFQKLSAPFTLAERKYFIQSVWAPETPTNVSGERQSLLEQRDSSKNKIFPMETFSTFGELLLRPKSRFKSDHVSFA